MKGKELTRRDFIKGAALTGAGLALGSNLLSKLDASAQESVKIYLPLILKAPTSSRVVHVHDSDATDWNFSTGYYWEHVNQGAVNNMVDRGVMELTGTGTVADAWRALIPNYQSGEKVAIKVNFNNSWDSGCYGSSNRIDALIEPVNAVINGLKAMGVAGADILIYDAVRVIPYTQFSSRCVDGNVRFVGNYFGPSECHERSTLSSVYVNFSQGGIPAQRIAGELIGAAHLINMPIMKGHGFGGVTLGFKNHFGTIENPNGLHPYIVFSSSQYSSSYNPMVDIYLNTHIRDKTRLIIGDGLFGNWVTNTDEPRSWSTFGGAPNSLFFATDPVAIDSVMADFILAERDLNSHTWDYLSLAAAAGLGTFERGDPWGSGYSQIEYVRIDL